MQQIDSIIPLEDKRKYIKVGKDFFLFDPIIELDPIKESQNNNRLFALNLPKQYSENFLSANNITLYLLDYLKYVREKQPEIKFAKETVREQILRWFFAKDKKEKEGIFAYLLKLGKTQNLSFTDEVILLTLFVREKDKISDEKFIEDKLNYVLSMESHTTLSFLNNVANLVKALYHIKRGEWETAYYSINDIDSENGLPHNAIFYSIIIKLNMEELDDAKNLLNSMINYDKDRVNFAIQNYHVRFYDIILYNSFIKNLFKFSEGTLIIDFINNIYEVAQDNLGKLSELGQYFKLLQHNKYNQFRNDELNRKIEFLKVISIKYANSKSFLFLSSIPTFFFETISIINEVLLNIRKHFDDIVVDSLKRYDEKIEYLKEAHSRNDLDKAEILSKEDEKNNRLTKEFEEKINGEIKYYQEMFENYDSQSDTSTIAVFKNAFAYNLIFSLFVILAGGFAEYSNYYLHEIASLAGFLSIVISGGLKWGFISFILGSIVSIIVFINSAYDRYSAKNNLTQKINSLNFEKEHAKTAFLAKAEEKKKAITERFNKSKEKMAKEIQNLQESKVEEKQNKIESLAEEKKSYTNPLEEILAQN